MRIIRRVSILCICLFLICSTLGASINVSARNKVCLADLERITWERYTGNMGDTQLENLDSKNLRNGNVGIDGTVYHNGFEAWIARWNFRAEISWIYSTYNLDCKYTLLTGKTSLIPCYNSTNFDTTLYFYGDGQLLYSQNLTDESYRYDFNVDVSGVNELKIYIKDNVAVKGGTSFAIYDLFLYGDDIPSNDVELPEKVEYNGHTYQIFDIGMTWEESKTYCEQLGGHLAVISSQEEQDAVESVLQSGKKNFYWLGGYKENDIWTTVTGEQFDMYTNWKEGEPNNSASPDAENKLQIFRKSIDKYIFGEWNDLSNSGQWQNDYFGLGNCGFVCEWGTEFVENEKKAIIVVPGITGSELYGILPNGYDTIWIGEIVDTVSGLKYLICDKYGNSQSEYAISAPIFDKYSSTFGTLGLYTNLVRDLQYTYDSDFGGSGQYEVVFFSYDWRLTNTLAAEKLNKFIVDSEYTDVVFVAHSMGGIVTSHYVNNYGDSKVEKIITIGTPFYGAPKALNALENGKFLDLSPFTRNLLKVFTKNIDWKIIKEMGKNMAGLYELLPNEKYFDNGNYYLADYSYSPIPGFWYLHGFDYIKTKEIVKGREWYNEYLYTQFESLQNGLEKTYKKMRSQEIDTYTIVGYNSETLTCMEYEKTLTGSKIIDLDINLKGDGTVPLISATMNNSLKSNRIYYVNKIKHSDLVDDGRVFQLVKNIINGNGDNNYGESNVSSYNYNCEKTIFRGDIIETALENTFGFTGYKIKAACPIEMSLYNSRGEFIGKISPESYETSDDYCDNFYHCGENGEIMIAFVDDETRISIVGTDEGTMDFEIEKYVDGNVEGRVFYDDVKISKGVELNTTTDLRDTNIQERTGIIIKPTEKECAEHVYYEEWKYDENQHWQECLVCNEKESVESHNGEEKCSVCGYALNRDNSGAASSEPCSPESENLKNNSPKSDSKQKIVVTIALVIFVLVVSVIAVILIKVGRSQKRKRISKK